MPNPGSNVAADGIEGLNKAVRLVRLLIRIGLTIILVLFVNSLLRQLPKPSLSDVESYLVLKAAFIMYMYSWYFGANFDLNVQNDIFRNRPGSLSKGIALIVILIAMFTLFFYFDSPRPVSAVFIVFLTSNVLGWLYLKAATRALLDTALAQARGAALSVWEVKGLIFEEYMFGDWQWWRFGVGGAAVIVATAIGFAQVSIPGTPTELLFHVAVFGAVVVLEAWMWYRRVKLRVLWERLDWLQERGFISRSL